MIVQSHHPFIQSKSLNNHKSNPMIQSKSLNNHKSNLKQSSINHKNKSIAIFHPILHQSSKQISNILQFKINNEHQAPSSINHPHPSITLIRQSPSSRPGCQEHHPRCHHSGARVCDRCRPQTHEPTGRFQARPSPSVNRESNKKQETNNNGNPHSTTLEYVI
jgi:hypothetical protein